MTQDEITHIRWIYFRMVNVHKESPKVDYMRKLKAITQTKETNNV